MLTFTILTEAGSPCVRNPNNGGYTYHCHDVCAINDEHADGCEAVADCRECDYAPSAGTDFNVLCLCSGCVRVMHEAYGCTHTESMDDATACDCVKAALYG